MKKMMGYCAIYKCKKKIAAENLNINMHISGYPFLMFISQGEKKKSLFFKVMPCVNCAFCLSRLGPIMMHASGR